MRFNGFSGSEYGFCRIPEGVSKAKTAQAKRKGKTLKKQVKQARRIHTGVQSGQLTKRETRRLVRQQKHIQKTKKRMIRNDGKLSKTNEKY